MFKRNKKKNVSPYSSSREKVRSFITERSDNSANDEEKILYFNYNFINDSPHMFLSGALTSKELILMRCDGTVFSVCLDRIENAECIQCVGCVSVECLLDGETSELFRSDMSNAKQLIKLPKLIKDAKEGKKSDLKEIKSVCPKCKRPFSPGSNKCLKCEGRDRLIKRIFQFAKPHLGALAAITLMFFIISGLNLLAPYLNRLLIDTYIMPEGGIFPQDRMMFVPLIIAIAVTSLLVTLCSVLRSVISIKIGNRISAEFREKVFQKAQELTLAAINRYTSGELITRITSDTDMMKSLIVNLFPELIQQLIILVSVIPIILIIDPLLAIFVFVPMPVIVMLYYFSNRKIRRMYHRQWRAGAELNTYLHDVFTGIRVVKAFGTEHKECKRFDEAAKKQARISERNECTWNLIIPTMGFFIGIGEYAVLFIAGSKIISGTMTLGEMSQLLSYVAVIYGPLRWMSNVPRRLSRIMTSLNKAFEIIEEEPDITDDEKPLTSGIIGNISLNNISFGYEEGVDVLKNVSFDIKKGEMVGLVGRSGVGKSTLINLIMRLYDVTDGNITIDGSDIKKYSQNYLRSQIGVVLQETFLFKGTVYQNIAYAKPEATPEEVINAAKLASAHGFIMSMPDGYNTYIGEGGSTLSGGERQRIAIARAILRDPRILILDEATSSLDTETESEIQDALSALIKNRTTIAIAHRLSTLKNAAKLVVLEKGTVEEEGTHNELLVKHGRYYKLVMAQRSMQINYKND